MGIIEVKASEKFESPEDAFVFHTQMLPKHCQLMTALHQCPFDLALIFGSRAGIDKAAFASHLFTYGDDPQHLAAVGGAEDIPSVFISVALSPSHDADTAFSAIERVLKTLIAHKIIPFAPGNAASLRNKVMFVSKSTDGRNPSAIILAPAALGIETPAPQRPASVVSVNPLLNGGHVPPPWMWGLKTLRGFAARLQVAPTPR